MYEWTIGSVIVKGKRRAVIRQLFPKVVAVTNRRGALIASRETLLQQGWRLNSEVLQPQPAIPTPETDSEQP